MLVSSFDIRVERKPKIHPEILSPPLPTNLKNPRVAFVAELTGATQADKTANISKI